MDKVKVDVPREEVPDWAKTMAPPGAPGGMSGPKITEPQRKFLLSLIEEREIKPGQEGKLDLIMKCLRISEDPEEYGMSKAKASELITWFLTKPKKARTGPDPDQPHQRMLPDVPAGYYAVPNEEGKLAFYTVSRPDKGDWKGWTFVSVWASDEKHRIRGLAATKAILEKIAADPDAGPRFGREIGRCYVCGRTLTDELSRQLGIGPVCRGF
jgi:hypothetical protein